MPSSSICTPAASLICSAGVKLYLPRQCCLTVLCLEFLLCPQEQQQAISAGLSSFAQPQLHEEHEEDGAAGEDEYDPEDADMQLGF